MATIKPRGKTWQLNWSDADGQHRVSLGKISKREAGIRLREKELELATGRRYGSSGISLATFALDYLEWYKLQWPSTYSRTAGIIKYQLEPEFGLLDLDTITPQDVTRWIIKRSAEVKPATVTKEARTLQALLRKAVEWRAIDAHLLNGHKPPPERTSKAPYFYTADQLKRLYWASYAHETTWQFYANTGMRRNEGLFLRLENIRPASIMVESLDDNPTKSRRWREIPLNETAQACVELLKERTTGAYLLPRIRPPSLTRAFDTCANRVGLPGSLHTLRHTFISHLVMAGVDLPTVQKLAGHASINTTMRYAHLAEEHKSKAVLKIAL